MKPAHIRFHTIKVHTVFTDNYMLDYCIYCIYVRRTNSIFRLYNTVTLLMYKSIPLHAVLEGFMVCHLT